MKKYVHEADMWPDAASALKQSLSRIPGFNVAIIAAPLLPTGNRPDLLAHLTHAEHQVTLIGEIIKSGEPRHARAAFYQMNKYRHALPGALGILIAPYISPETAKLCRDGNIGYQDLAGNCHIAFDGIYIHIEGKPNPFAHSRSLISLYQSKAERVLRVLLTQQLKSWRLQALAGEAEVSIGQVYKVKELLLEREWLAENNQGITVTKPQEMLAAWLEHYRFSKHQTTAFHTLIGLHHFELDFSAMCRSLNTSCAFTSLAAAARYAPYATYQRTLAYVSGDLTDLQRAFDLTPIETGANVVLLTPYDDGVFYGARQEQDVSLASPLQTYLDLHSAGGRGIEAAEELLQKEIVPN